MFQHARFNLISCDKLRVGIFLKTFLGEIDIFAEIIITKWFKSLSRLKNEINLDLIKLNLVRMKPDLNGNICWALIWRLIKQIINHKCTKTPEWEHGHGFMDVCRRRIAYEVCCIMYEDFFTASQAYILSTLCDSQHRAPASSFYPSVLNRPLWFRLRYFEQFCGCFTAWTSVIFL